MSRSPAKKPTSPGGPIRPLIEIVGDLAEMTHRAFEVLIRTNDPPAVFRYADGLARVERDDRMRPAIKVLDPDRLRNEMAGRGRWVVRHDDKFTAVHPPPGVIRNMLATPEPALPVLTHVIQAPIFAADGSLHLNEGYNAATRAFYSRSPDFLLPPVPVRPSAVDLQRALDIIREATCDFPFAGLADFAHALALRILPFIQELIDAASPLHAIDKPVPGSGASLLTHALLSPPLGQIPTMTEGSDEDEWRKRITATYLTGTAVIVIDNVRHPLDSAALASAITEPVWTDRFLGQSKMVVLPSRRTWVTTGNNIRSSDEIRSRMLRIRLDPGLQNPENRSGFRHPNLHQWTREHRAELVWASLILGQAWLAEGRPDGTQVMGRFERWSRVIGGVLEVAGVPGFLGNTRESLDDVDLTTTAWAALIELWWANHQEREVSVAILWPLVQGNVDLIAGLNLGTRDEASQRTHLGLELGKMRDRIFNGRRITAAGFLHGARSWKLTLAG